MFPCMQCSVSGEGFVCKYFDLSIVRHVDIWVFPRSGEGAGAGPELAVIRRAILLLTHEEAHWRPLGMYRTLNMHPSFDPIPERQTAFLACGVLALLHLVLLKSGPDPISPFLMHLVMDGRQTFTIDSNFLSALEPDLSKRLAPWVAWKAKPHERIKSDSDLGALLAHAEIAVSAR